MLTKDQKYTALKTAIEIAKAYAESGSDGHSPATVLDETYKVITRITDKLESPEDSKK